jgi:hypothetical protein
MVLRLLLVILAVLLKLQSTLESILCSNSRLGELNFNVILVYSSQFIFYSFVIIPYTLRVLKMFEFNTND